MLPVFAVGAHFVENERMQMVHVDAVVVAIERDRHARFLLQSNENGLREQAV